MIQIKKRIGLDFLGEEYKEGYLEFNSISIRDYEKLLKVQKALNPEDGAANLNFIKTTLEDRFVGGKIPQAGELKDIVKEDLIDFDADTLLRSFQVLTGQVDPKA